MNETPGDKKLAPTPPLERLTRIRCAHLYFAENIDLAYGSSSSQISNLKCGKGEDGRPYYECDFIPAWQSFEIYFVRGEQIDSQMIPACHIRRWVKA